MLRCYRAARSTMALKSRVPSLLFSAPTIAHARFYRNTSVADITTSSAAASVKVSTPTAPTDAPPQTYFDYLDRMWNAKWFGTVDEHTVTSSATHAAVSGPSWFEQAFTACQSTLGVEAATLIFLAGAATRLCTLFLSLYGERAGERMRLALPELKKPQEDFNRVYYNDLASAMEVQIAASVLKSHRRAVFRKYKTSNWKCVASLAMSPVIMTGLYQVSAMCENVALDVGSSSFLWCDALTLPDPFMILPVLTCVVTLLNFELSISKEIKTGWMKNIIWGARLGCLCVIPIFSTLRSGVCLYFIGMNVVGLLQPLLLRSVFFRRWFAFPSAEELAVAAPPAAHSSAEGKREHVMKSSRQSFSGSATTVRERIVAAVSSTNALRASSADPTQDMLHASMTVQFPYLSHLLNPLVEENVELFAKARNKQSKPDIGRRGPITSFSSPHSSAAAGGRYARGANPLMREVPLHRQDGAVGAAAAAGAGSSRVPAAPVGAVHHDTVGRSVAGSTTRPAPKNKGTTFASSGWKSAQLSFDENDFIPNYTHKHDSSSSTKHK